MESLYKKSDFLDMIIVSYIYVTLKQVGTR